MLDFKKIESILDKLDPNNPEDWELSYKHRDAWMSFVHNFSNFLTSENITNVIEKERLYFQSDMSEESFKKLFPEAKYDKFMTPYDFKNIPMNVSKKKIQKVAFQLQKYIPIKYETLCDVVYWLYYNREKNGFGKKAIMLELFCKNHECHNLWLEQTIEEKLIKEIAS